MQFRTQAVRWIQPQPTPAKLAVLLAATLTVAQAAPPVVGLWRFNEGSGTNVLDSSGLNNNGSLQTDTGTAPTWVSGQAGFGGALQFSNDGSSHNYVEIPGSSSLQVGLTATNAWTITAWAYEDSGGTGDFIASYGRILVIDDGQAFQLESGASGDAQLYTWSRAAAAWQLGWGVGDSVSPLLDQWEHWAVVYDGVNLTVYRNGNQGSAGGVASNPVTAALAYPGYAGRIRLGTELGQSGNRNWNGKLDDVAVFAGALTQDEIRQVMSGDFSAHLGGPARIVSQPQPTTGALGQTATFGVAAQGQPPLAYQWYFNGTNLLAGATSAVLQLTNVSLSEAGYYSVVVSNPSGRQTSLPALLTIRSAEPQLVGLWRFNEAAGTNAADASGHGNNGVFLGDGGNLPEWIPGQTGFGSALNFVNNGASHAYVGIPGSDSLKIGATTTDPWSITAWVCENGNGSGDFAASYGRVLVIDDGAAFQFESGASGDAEMYTWARANNPWQIGWGAGGNVAPLLNEWVHWAIVYDGANLLLYRDGNQGPNGGMASQPVVAQLGYAGYAGAIEIGSELGQDPSRQWNGAIDDVAVFQGALSPAQVQTVMSGDFSAFTPVSLTVTSANGMLTVSWPAAGAGSFLQAAGSLTSPAWGNIQATPTLTNGVYAVTLAPAAGATFFRLSGQ